MMDRMHRSMSIGGETFFDLEKKWILEKEGEDTEILYSSVHKDLLYLQLRSEKQNQLYIQSFPPGSDLGSYKKFLKKEAVVIMAEERVTFVYYPNKSSLDILCNDTKAGTIKGKLRRRKVLRGKHNETYIMVIDNEINEISVDILGEMELRQIPLPFSYIFDFQYINEVYYILGKDSTSGSTMLLILSSESKKTVGIPLRTNKLAFVHIFDEFLYTLHDGINFYYVKVDTSNNAFLSKTIKLPLTDSFCLRNCIQLEDRKMLIQDSLSNLTILNVDDPGKEYLLNPTQVKGSLIHQVDSKSNSGAKSTYIVTSEKDYLQFYELTQTTLIEYLMQIHSFDEIHNLRSLLKNNPEAEDYYYKMYFRENIDYIYQIKKPLKKIRSLQTKIGVLQSIAPQSYDKLDQFYKILQKEIDDKPGNLNYSKALNDFKHQLDVFMQLYSSYDKNKYLIYKKKGITDLIMEHIGNEGNVGLLLSGYINESLLHYDEIIENIVSFEVAGNYSKKDNKCFIEKILPLGIERKTELISGIFGKFWKSVKDRLGDEEFEQFCKDKMKFFKALRCCFKKNKRNIGYIYSIIKCGYKRKIEGLDLLLLDMKIRKLINLPPSESYSLDQSKGCCSIETFMSFITRNGNATTNILQSLKEFYDLMNKYIKSSGLVKKELFSLLEQYLMKAELKQLNELLGELLSFRGKKEGAQQFEFLLSSSQTLFELAMKHVYTQDNVSHIESLKDLEKILQSLLAPQPEIKKAFEDYLTIFHKHIEIASIMRDYGFKNTTYREICGYSNLEDWKVFVEYISRLTNEKISLDECGKYLIEIQKSFITHFVARSKDSWGSPWKKCISDMQNFHRICKKDDQYRYTVGYLFKALFEKNNFSTIEDILKNSEFMEMNEFDYIFNEIFPQIQNKFDGTSNIDEVFQHNIKMLDLLLKLDPGNTDVEDEKTFHVIAQRFKKCAGTSVQKQKLVNIRKAIQEKTIIDLLINSDIDLESPEIVKSMRNIFPEECKYKLSNQSINLKLAQKLIANKRYVKGFEYLHESMNPPNAEEAVQYFLNLTKHSQLQDAEVPLYIIHRAIESNVEPKILSELLQYCSRNQVDHSDFDKNFDYYSQSVAFKNDISTYIMENLAPNPKQIDQLIHKLINSPNVHIPEKISIASAILGDITLIKTGIFSQEDERLILIEKAKELKENLVLLKDIKHAISKSEKDHIILNENEFLTNPSYRKEIANKYAKVTIGLKLAKTGLLRIISPIDYAKIAVLSLFEKNMKMEDLIKECDQQLENLEMDINEFIFSQILPNCFHNKHYLYCLYKLEIQPELYEYLKALEPHMKSIPLQYICNFGEKFHPTKLTPPTEHFERSLQQLIPELSSYLQQLLLMIFQQADDSNVFLFYAILGRMNKFGDSNIRPSFAILMWIWNKLHWMRSQTNSKTTRKLKDSSSSGLQWLIGGIPLKELFLNSYYSEYLHYFNIVFQHEVKEMSSSFSLGILSKLIHQIEKLSGKSENPIISIVHNLWKYKSLANEREALLNTLSRNPEMSFYTFLHHSIQIPVLHPAIIKSTRVISSKIFLPYLRSAMKDVVDYLENSQNILHHNYYFKLDRLHFNDVYYELLNHWNPWVVFSNYFNFVKIVSPEIANISLQNLWKGKTTHTVKIMLIMQHESLLSKLYGKEEICQFLLENCFAQMKCESSVKFSSIEIFKTFVKNYIKTHPEMMIEDYGSLISLANITAAYIEGASSRNSECVRYILDVLEEGGQVTLKAEIATDL